MINISNTHNNLQCGSQNEGIKKGLGGEEQEEEEVVRSDMRSAFTKQLKGYGSDLSLYDDTLFTHDSTSNEEEEAMSDECLDVRVGSCDLTNCSLEDKNNR